MKFSNESSWYVLFVNTGQEYKVKEICEREFGGKLKAIVPTRELRERKNGKWTLVKRKLFPGYVLLEGIIDLGIYNRLNNITGVIKILSNSGELSTIAENELQILGVLINNVDNNIGISQLYKNNDIIRIVSGPLVGFEGRILKIDARKGRAKVSLDFLNEKKVVDLGIEMVDKL